MGHQRRSTKTCRLTNSPSKISPAICCRTRPPTQKIGSGFNRCNITCNEGGAIDDEYYVLYARDRTETTSQVWLGLTAGCAVCHDHKFDPLTQKDFYSLSAFFNNTTQKAMDGNIKDTPPVMVIPKPEDEKRWGELPGEEKAAEDNLAQLKQIARREFTNWLARPDFTALGANAPVDAPAFHAPLDDGGTNGATIFIGGAKQNLPLATNAVWQEGAVAGQGVHHRQYAGAGRCRTSAILTRDEAFSYAVWVKLDRRRRTARCSRAWRTRTALIAAGICGWRAASRRSTSCTTGRTTPSKSSAKRHVPKDSWNHVCVTYDGSSQGGRREDLSQRRAAGSDRGYKTRSRKAIRTTAPFKIGQRDTGSPVPDAGLQDLRIYARVLKPRRSAGLARGAAMQMACACKPAASDAARNGRIVRAAG